MNTDNIDTSLLDDLLSLREDLKREAVFVDAAIAAERASLTFQKYGVRGGSIVRRRMDGRLYRVVSVDTSWWPGRPWLVGNPQRKDGTYGTGFHNLFGDWELVE